MRRAAVAACIGTLVASPVLAEGIGVIGPSGGDVAMLKLPLLGTVVLAIIMLTTAGLRRYLGWAILIVAVPAVVVFLMLLAPISNGALVALLFGALLAPWILFLVFLGCFIRGMRRKMSEA